MDAKQTPLIDLLEAVPADARLVVEDSPYSTSFHPVGRLCHEAAAALRERLAREEALDRMVANAEELGLYEPARQEQEPVAYAVYHRAGGGKSLHWPEQHSADGDATAYQLMPLYSAPLPAQQPLTDEQIRECWEAALVGSIRDFRIFARAIEAAHGITGEKK